MKETICPYCSKGNEVMYAPLKTYIASYLDGKVTNIICYYECKCGKLYSTSTRVLEER